MVQALSEQLMREHIQLSENMALRESQVNILARNMTNPAKMASLETLKVNINIFL